MKYEKEFREFKEKLTDIYNSDKSTRIDLLHPYIMELRGFIRHSDLPHPNFEKIKNSYLDLFMENAKIIQGSHQLPENKKESKFADCYTNMISDLDEIKSKYLNIQGEQSA